MTTDDPIPPGHNRCRYPPRECQECGSPFTPARVDQQFCCDRCRKDHNSRRKERGLAAIDALHAWRGERKPGALTALSRLIDGFNREDRERRRRNQEALAAIEAAKRQQDQEP